MYNKMSQQNKSTLQSAINTDLADNTSGDISAADVRDNLINMTDSLLFNNGSQGITGSLTITEGITGSLQGTATTASYVENAISASYATTASVLLGSVTSASFASTASYIDPTFISASAAASGFGSGGGSTIDTGSFATTGSNAFFGTQVISGSVIITGSLNQANRSLATGLYSYVGGFLTTASGDYSRAIGFSSKATGLYAHAEGQNTTAQGGNSHTEGTSTSASGDFSHAEGYVAYSIGYASHAEGRYTIAKGDYSHAEGNFTIASGSSQHVQGQYNTHGDDTSLMIVGNGTQTFGRKDAFKVRMSGSIVLPTTQSSAPSWTGTDGEMVFATVTGDHYFYVWMSGAWRSGSLA